MCGIAGILNWDAQEHVREEDMRRMLASIRHRGPDQFGIYLDGPVGLGSARLSIIDLSNGQQPITNKDASLWIVFNGEIFNYRELRSELEAGGHLFATQTDTEVILHLYEEYGPACLNKLNGQFAIAIWNTKKKELFLARDRLGVRPLFYTQDGGALVFGSEIKAILTDRRVHAETDPLALAQIFTFWATISPRTIFCDIRELPPGYYLLARSKKVEVFKYWELDFLCDDNPDPIKADLENYLEEFQGLLMDAVRIRLHADVPVGAYLSGGLDSSMIAAIIRQCSSSPLETFSIAFDDFRYDESGFQGRMARFLGTEHHTVHASHSDIGRVFPEVIWHTETPIMRTSPAPMFLLSKLAQDRGFKVVLTGEGADEFLAGYDIFKEAKIRRFWARNVNSKWRPLLLKRLYPDIGELGGSNGAFLEAFFGGRLEKTDSLDHSHAIRWRNNSRTWRFFSEEMNQHLKTNNGVSFTAYPDQFRKWGPLERGQYLESVIFLSQYLLSSQGDRMGMAHSVEGRFPFLDPRMVKFCARLPANFKLRGLNEKYLLKRLGRDWLPEEIWRRLKRPYRAPIHRAFFNDARADYVDELLSEREIKETGFFKPSAVAQLVRKLKEGSAIGETDDMALAGILSTQLVYHHFVAQFEIPHSLAESDDVKVCHGAHATAGISNANET